MDWRTYFESIETQAAAEFEHERRVLEDEHERARLAKITFAERVATAAFERAAVCLRVNGELLRGNLQACGNGWVAISHEANMTIVPLSAIESVQLGAEECARSTLSIPTDGMTSRMTFGFLCRDFARRRVPVQMSLIGGNIRHGTIDRAGADHLDLAVHEPGTARRHMAVNSYDLIPLHRIAWLRPVDPVQRQFF